MSAPVLYPAGRLGYCCNGCDGLNNDVDLVRVGAVPFLAWLCQPCVRNALMLFPSPFVRGPVIDVVGLSPDRVPARPPGDRRLLAAIAAYAVHHGPSSDHHSDECPAGDAGGCAGCRVDAELHAALLAAGGGS